MKLLEKIFAVIIGFFIIFISRNTVPELLILGWITVSVSVLFLLYEIKDIVCSLESGKSNRKEKAYCDDEKDDECGFSIGNRDYTKAEYEFWTGAIEYIAKFANDGDYVSVGELMLNILNDKDNVKYAYELYTLIDHAIYYLYPLRDIGNCKDIIIDLGFRGISLIDGYIAQAKGYLTWRYPTKLAILLEKEGRIDEAIELCDFLASRGVRDTGYDSFEARKSKLEQRQERTCQKHQGISTQ